MLDWSVVLPTFLTAAVEWVEALTIVLAVSLTIGWRGAVSAAGAALLALVARAAVTGGVLDLGARVADLQILIGIFLLLFGMRWLAKAIAPPGGAEIVSGRGSGVRQHGGGSVQRRPKGGVGRGVQGRPAGGS